jgi:hypothetical protein
MCAVVQKHWYQQERIRFKLSVTLMCVDCILWIAWVLLQTVGRTPWELMLPPLFICHGDRDTLVPHEWGQHTFNRLLKQLGVHGEFHTIHNTLHEMKEKEVRQLYDWIDRCLLPPVWLQGFYIMHKIQVLVKNKYFHWFVYLRTYI